MAKMLMGSFQDEALPISARNFRSNSSEHLNMLFMKSRILNEGSIVNLLKTAQTADVRVHVGITSVAYRSAAANIHTKVMSSP